MDAFIAATHPIYAEPLGAIATKVEPTTECSRVFGFLGNLAHHRFEDTEDAVKL